MAALEEDEEEEGDGSVKDDVEDDEKVDTRLKFGMDVEPSP